ncbi:hypothetical protein P171DRAFT_485346 [Karstenula rhodostoma CBS 690.94]|uniref:Uncharacterized protein n=1 Tax=Karstenula rhodostoma CBS 690.94 TaxID=1392251 RepID=A0A9P4PM27_9PLEO|nr:hypothetical protein P171DRAFT_485346 [Karstenula rhodostoma CBS 690.94]
MNAPIQSLHPSSPTALLAEMQLSNLLNLYTLNLTAIANTLALLPNQRARIVLRAWRVVQTTQQLVRAATQDADLEMLAHWVRWAAGVVAEACKLQGKSDAVAAVIPTPIAGGGGGGGGGAIHPTLLAEQQNRATVHAWLAGASPAVMQVTQARRRAWQLGLDLETACAMDGCACCAARPLGLGLGSGWLHTRARAMGLGRDINTLTKFGLGIDVGGGVDVLGDEVLEEEEAYAESGVSGSTTKGQAGVLDGERRGAFLEALWEEVREVSARHVDVCGRAGRAMAVGMEEVVKEDFAAHALECDSCFDNLIGG